MAFITAQQIAQLSLELLRRRLVLPMTVARVPTSQLVGPNGGRISVRVRQPRASNEQETAGADISGDLSAIDEVETSVTLSHLFDGTIIGDEDMALEVEDFASQVLEPLVSSVGTGAEDQLAEAWNNEAVDGTIEFPADPDLDADKAVILAARRTLTRADVPLGGRFAACSPEVAERLLAIPDFTRVDATGATTALREATLGRLFGFTFLETAGLDVDTAVFYHRSAAVWANRAPAEASGAETSTVTSDGISLRAVRSFMPTNLAEAVIVSTLAGAAVVYEDADESVPTESQRFIKVGVAAA